MRAVYFFVLIAFKASVKRDLYRLAVFSLSVRLRIALSSSEHVAEANFSARAASAADSAARILRPAVRTRVRFMRLITARRPAWRIFFKTDLVFFMCFTGVPWAMPCSFGLDLGSTTISDHRTSVNFRS